MNFAATIATAARVLRQLRHDPRTLGLLLVVPCVLMGLLAWVFKGTPTFDHVGAPLLGVFPFVVMFLVTSVATLRERTTGTLERLLTMPIGKFDFLVGYALAFGLLAVAQAGIVSALSLLAFGLDVSGPVWLLVAIAVLDALLGMALGLLSSAFATTEFQAVQFMPAIVLPQFLLCGLLVPRDEMTLVLRVVSDVLPLSYAVDAMRAVTTSGSIEVQTWVDLAIIAACIGLALVLGAATLRRRTP